MRRVLALISAIRASARERQNHDVFRSTVAEMDLLAPLHVPAKLTLPFETSRRLATLRDRYHSTRRDLCARTENLRPLMARGPEPSSMVWL